MNGTMIKKKARNIASFLFVIFGLMLLGYPAIAGDYQTYSIKFLDGKVNIKLNTKKKPDGKGVSADITKANSKSIIHVDFYEPEGGVMPEIKSLFVAGYKSKKLFIIVSWGSDSDALGTGGSVYQVFVYDEHVDTIGKQLRLHPNIDLTKRFGVGFDGFREGRAITYKYKTAATVRRQLLEWGF